MNRSSVLAAVTTVLLASSPSTATVWNFDWAGSVTAIAMDTGVTGAALEDRAHASFRFDTASATLLTTAPGATTYAVRLTSFLTQVQRRGGASSLLWDVPSVDATLTLLDDQDGQDGYRFSVALGGPTTTVDYSALGAGTAWTSPTLGSDFRAAALPTQQLSFLVGTAPVQERILATVVATVGGSTVPEPASWTMMVAGFAAVGTGLRAGRRARLATAA